eukprot:m.87328 g.87328  ORF g.87328 m.87328 type:complete len:88 (+) comp12238_c0_seq7:205-468(+)
MEDGRNSVSPIKRCVGISVFFMCLSVGDDEQGKQTNFTISTIVSVVTILPYHQPYTEPLCVYICVFCCSFCVDVNEGSNDIKLMHHA